MYAAGRFASSQSKCTGNGIGEFTRVFVGYDELASCNQDWFWLADAVREYYYRGGVLSGCG